MTTIDDIAQIVAKIEQKDEIAPEIQLAIIEQKLAQWRNTAFDAELDVKIAKILDDEAMKERAANNLKRCLQAVAMLEEMKSTYSPAARPKIE